MGLFLLFCSPWSREQDRSSRVQTYFASYMLLFVEIRSEQDQQRGKGPLEGIKGGGTQQEGEGERERSGKKSSCPKAESKRTEGGSRREEATN